MSNDNERKNIRAAMDRLLAGTPLRSDGALTVLALAAEADVKRHVLTHRHTDLKDEFYAKVRAQGRVPDSERKLRAELKKTKERLAELIEENKRQQAEIETFARVVSVLTIENHQLRDQSGHKRAPVVALRPDPEPGS
ncbi:MULTISPECIES: hypothetical protein [unclassified Streptomyces]|uniref:hypothetical protein n=1 Tax=unclassified Streptomyces TaxID=2593676 RepID=UPI002E7A3D1C|nr:MULTISPECIES: hypothetical protein [unclassified Streptomyces]MEE1759220.1 hypothetical protein [Streptomyces sp. SP18BB07]MEE1833768.1 hypothetical protein [Streptomyces sp. SP17KL33]